ncbi:MAG: flavodoxin-dependent (E)-4-hydroxy-3-methylbut-2-enyl-diphosphate synthase [Oscillospiraceae bacterium]|jgi:(E)-4-hydroxy-3-methylbut-2-enyl-diphosphate synthase|nr:flavodoxin-dependent (E)-4-hydroxy-3-methylbut-2-enyl-diphosphate synthase [Oscillospiraceae bacterium]
MRKRVKVGNITLGDGNIYVQSMLKKPAHDIEANVKQALELQEAGCEIIRAAVPEVKDAKLIYELKQALKIPVVADIHFEYKIALESVNAGADKIRLNPGNLEPHEREIVARECQKREIPIRIGINAGSLEKDLLQKHGVCAEALVESALRSAKMLEDIGFCDIALSVKASDVKMTIDAYRLLHKKCEYPLHLGVTEAGTKRLGILKSAVGIGSLLCDGIGDTIRVSLTDEPIEEIYAALDILKAAGKGKGAEIISCPTCGRTKIDIIKLANEIETLVTGIKKPIKIAVMGCAVNGPGEAREADIGIAAGDGSAVLFKKSKIICRITEENMLDTLKKEIEEMI